MTEIRHADIVVVGAGPAGMAAALRAAESGLRVTVVDDNPSAGGQIWRGEQLQPSTSQASFWFRKLQNSGVEMMTGARVISADAPSRTLLVDRDRAFDISFKKLILATGARELFLPFAGWTLPNVMGVGGLQALVKSGLPIERKRIVVAGSGPLLLAAAAYFRKHGARVVMIAEQSPWSRLFPFGFQLVRHPGKLWQALRLKLSLGTTRYVPGCWVEAAIGEEKVVSVRLRRGGKSWTEDCDYLAVAYGFQPNTELAALLGCSIDNTGVRVDDLQQTSIESIYCAGESTGIGGVDLSLVEGEIAGYAASGRPDMAKRLFAARRRAGNFASSLDAAFALRDELRHLALSGTIVCRCEDVTLSRLQSCDSWRSAKLHARCGMGPCQGRVCGPIVRFLFGWNAESVRPPVFPARVASLVSEEIHLEGVIR